MKVLVVDRQPLIRMALQHLVQGVLQNATVIGLSEADDLARDGVDIEAISMVVLESQLRSLSDLDQFTHLHNLIPSVPIVLHATSGVGWVIQEVYARGGKGVLLKTDDCQLVENAFRIVIGGSTYVHPNTLNLSDREEDPEPIGTGREVRADSQALADERLAVLGLSGREREVAKLLALGQSNKAIALALGIAESTTKVHVSAVLKVLRVSRRAEVMPSLVSNPV